MEKEMTDNLPDEMPETIWLEHTSACDPSFGQMWCPDRDPLCEEADYPPVKYVRADKLEEMQARVKDLEYWNERLQREIRDHNTPQEPAPFDMNDLPSLIEEDGKIHTGGDLKKMGMKAVELKRENIQLRAKLEAALKGKK